MSYVSLMIGGYAFLALSFLAVVIHRSPDAILIVATLYFVGASIVKAINGAKS